MPHVFIVVLHDLPSSSVGALGVGSMFPYPLALNLNFQPLLGKMGSLP
jgi:hypothetical protein